MSLRIKLLGISWVPQRQGCQKVIRAMNRRDGCQRKQAAMDCCLSLGYLVEEVIDLIHDYLVHLGVLVPARHVREGGAGMLKVPFSAEDGRLKLGGKTRR
eukprot:753536-Hanusia_phi.AAC.6